MIRGSILVLAVFLAAIAACRSPLDIETPRIITGVNIDSVAMGLVNATKDTIIATINGRQINFAYSVERPRFYNGSVDSSYYITAAAVSSDPNGPNYTRLCLRLDAIHDTGVYKINAYYSAPKILEPNTPPEYGALFERRENGYSHMYRTGDGLSQGEIHVLVFDRVRKVIAGTFHFVGYNTEDDATETIQDGAFRLDLDP
jgi:hypothetical protein